MELRRLEILREFADRGSVAAVAEALHLTPSAVSQQLKVLAREAGVELLEPDGRRIRLTDAGRALVLRADEVISAVDRAREEMATYRSGLAGVRLAMFPSGATLLLPELLALAESAGLRVEAAHRDVNYGGAAAGLADFDVVVTHRDERMPPLREPRVAVTELMREPIDIVVPADSPLARTERVAVTELAEQNWISVTGGFPIDDVLQSISALTGVAPRITQRLQDLNTIEALVAAGHGIAPVPRYAVRHPGVVRLELAGVRAARVYEALTRPRPRRAAERVVDGLVEVADRLRG